MYKFLDGQGVVTEIVRYEKGSIFSVRYYGTPFEELELIKLETFHANGHISKLESFSSGLKHGKYKEFCDNGNIKTDGCCSNGIRSGLWTEYFRESRNMRIFYTNENEKNNSLYECYDNGRKKIFGEYPQRQKYGLWIAWFPNGVKESVITYNQGEQDGVFSYFNDNGNKKSEGLVSYKGQKEQRYWDSYGNSKNCTSVY